MKNHESQKQYGQSLEDQVLSIEQEARMVLPGIQALFGFQLVVVFNTSFKANLSVLEQIIHLGALFLVAVSAALVMAPAAYHRQAGHQISKHFVAMSSDFLAAAMVPLAIGMCLDIFLITRLILGDHLISGCVTGALFMVYAWTWFIFPRVRAWKIRNLPVHDIAEAKKSS